MHVWDGVAGVGISALLACMGIYLARLNQTYLLGQSVDPEIVQGIKSILTARPAIEEVHSVQSQWIGPYAFAYKAEVDFDGTYLAAKLLKRYQNEFLNNKKLSVDDVKLLLAWYAEDVMRTVEREVKDVEAQIQRKYPEAMYIELEPDSRKTNSSAIDDGRELHLKKIEIETLNQLEYSFRMNRLDELENVVSNGWKNSKLEELVAEPEADDMMEIEDSINNTNISHK